MQTHTVSGPANPTGHYPGIHSVLVLDNFLGLSNMVADPLLGTVTV